uniref:TIR domain-containing protein n=1 Tax=Biomphalaria glabrata TaxID=6526 RepID=A0A2C9KFW1_BIOGL
MMAACMPEESWQTFLESSLYDVPLHALRNSVCHRLALYLDIEDVVMHNGYIPNYGGLAELIGFSGLEIMEFERAKSPTQALLLEWKSRPDLKPKIGKLVEFLFQLDRIDVLTDCHQAINDEAKLFIDKESKALLKPIQDETVTPGPGSETPPYITRQDVLTGKKTYYDAYICYNPIGESSKDLEFVRELISRFESDKYRFTLFVPFRDDLPGMNEHAINAKIISERCRHMIVVLSKNFLQSEACEFQSTFAQSLSPGARNKRIVPIKIEDCVIPNILRIMACCDFTKKDLWDWSWDRLARSITAQLATEDFQSYQSSSESTSGFSRGYSSMSSLQQSNSPRSSSPDSGISVIQNHTVPIASK